MSISLFKHNQAALEAVMVLLRETSTAAVIHPTGTEKSFIGFQLCEAQPATALCWLSPSEYIFKTAQGSHKQRRPERMLTLSQAHLIP